MDSMTPPRLGRRAGLVVRRVRGVIYSPQSSMYILSVYSTSSSSRKDIYTTIPKYMSKKTASTPECIYGVYSINKAILPIESSLPSQASKKNTLESGENQRHRQRQKCGELATTTPWSNVMTDSRLQLAVGHACPGNKKLPAPFAA